MKSILVAIVSTVMLVGCVSPTKINSNQPLNKFWFEIKGNIEPGYRLWERNGGGIWTETYPSGFNSKFKEVGRTKVDGLDGDYVVKVSGDEENLLVVNSTTFIHIKNRLIIAYVYSNFNSSTDIIWLEAKTKELVELMLKVN